MSPLYRSVRWRSVQPEHMEVLSNVKKPLVICRTYILAPTQSTKSPSKCERRVRRSPGLVAVIGSVVPLTSFNSSVYSTPVLLLLRLFYNAAALNSTYPPAKNVNGSTDLSHGFAMDLALSASGTETFGTTHTQRSKLPISAFDSQNQLSTTAFYELTTTFGPFKVISITWAKALSSPLSHEFIQCIVEDVQTRKRYRIVVERHEDGDWVHTGLSWKPDTDPHYRLGMPLPLLSLIFEEGHCQPLLSSFAKLLAEVTINSPKYNPMKEMCWWFAEVVFERAFTQFGGKVKQWDFASLRYSFVFRTSLVRRNRLTEHARRFHSQNAADFEY